MTFFKKTRVGLTRDYEKRTKIWGEKPSATRHQEMETGWLVGLSPCTPYSPRLARSKEDNESH